MESPETVSSKPPGSVDLATEDRAVPSEEIIDAIHTRLDSMRDEIGVLQVRTSERAKPWFRQASTVSTLVALLALVFSVMSAIYADRRAREQDLRTQQQNIQNARTQLGELIQRLDAVPRENADLLKNYGHDPETLSRLAGNLNTENIALAGQAADIIKSIPGHVSATEYFAVATALGYSGLYDRAQEMFQAGMSVKTDQITRTALVQSYASLLFAVGDITGGRAKMQEALDIYQKQPTRFKGQVLSSNAFTHMFWSRLEVGARQCREAKHHFEEAEQLYRQLDSGIFKNQLAPQVEALRPVVNKCS
jgi:tetratricopeptide (TPR) repeat protein